jgi:hypothetical protein
MERLGRLVRVRAVEPLDRFRVRLEFEDDTQKEVDLEPYLHGPIFQPIRSDPVVFRSMKVKGGTIVWDNGADIDPDVLYYGLTPAWMEELALAEQKAA